MTSTLYEALAVLILILANLVLGFIGGYEYVTGGEAKKAVKIEQKQEIQYATDTVTTQNEGQQYQNTVSNPPAPAPQFRVCPSAPRKAPAAPAAGSQINGSSDLRTFDEEVPPAGRPVLDTTPLVGYGRNADAQVIGLQDYIKKVCRPQ